MSKRFKKLLFDSKSLPIKAQGELIKTTINEYMGQAYSQIDDMVVVGIQC